MNTQRLQEWFMAQPAGVKAAILALVAIPLGAHYLFPDVQLKDVLGFLPALGVLAVAGGVGGFFGWRYLERRRLDKQLAINRELAGQGLVRLVLPSRGVQDTWKTIAGQATNFAAFLSTALRQFPDEHVSLEIVGLPGGTLIQVWSPQDIFPMVVQGILSSFPNAQIREAGKVVKVADPLANLDQETRWAVLGLTQKASSPLKQVDEFSTESLAFVLSALLRAPGMGRVGVQVVLKAPNDKWATRAQQDVQKMQAALAGQRGAARKDKQRLTALEAKADALTGMAATVLVFAEPQSAGRFNRLLMAVTSTSRSPYNALQVVAQGQGPERVSGRHVDHKVSQGTILSAEEVATLWHVPAKGAGSIVSARGVYIPPPPEVVVVERPPFHPSHRIVGKGLMATGEECFIRWEHGFDTLVHSFICGPTGAGKSTLIASLVAQDVCGGRGAILMEPHRDLTLEVIKTIPPERIGDVLWLNPTAPDRSFGINLMDCSADPDSRDAAASALKRALAQIVGGEWDKAVQMKRLLNFSVGALMEAEPLPTLMHLRAFIRRDEYRETALGRVKNPVTREFWEEEYANWSKSKREEATNPVFNRLDPMVTQPLMAQVVAQEHTTLPMQRLMDAGKILLIDLSSNDRRLQETAEALGTLIVALVWSTAASRVKHRYPMPSYFWVDEFQRYVAGGAKQGGDFVNMLAEARGYGLGLNLATQYYSRLPDWMQQAVLSNCRTKFTSGIDSPDEARLMTRVFGVEEEKIRSMDAYTYLVRVSAQRRATDSFTVIGLPPMGQGQGKIDPERMRRAFAQANGGRLPLPQDHGGIPFDVFEGVTPMDAGERATWQRHQGEMRGIEDWIERAQYLAGLDEAAWAEYQGLRRKADLEEYQALLNDPRRVPEQDYGDIGPVARRVRRLSSLQVEVPRDEIEAGRLKLVAQSAAPASNWLSDMTL